MSNSSFSLSSSSSIPKGVCLCEVKAEIKTSWTQLNTGRRFFCCKNLKARCGCNYFDWYDDEMPLQAKRLGGWLKLGGLLDFGGLLKLGGLLELGGWLKLGGLLELAAWLELPGMGLGSGGSITTPLVLGHIFILGIG
ncbi:hypothetical protein BC332_22040 [Capsicum chinense]|nr:hypothetical protein BC332_22040 [Capsicum chinense]